MRDAMKRWMLCLLACGLAGCTMVSLERHTVAQTDSAVDLRYREVMDNLALVADDPSTLPSYSSIFSGTVSVQDQGQLLSTITWPFSAGSQVVDPSFNRQISQNWTLDPIMIPEKLEAIRAACQWAVGGRDSVYEDSWDLLIGPEEAKPGIGRHFGVKKKLEKLPDGWLRIGSRRDVPACACYRAHCGRAWVWVMPEDMKALADFTLIIQDIARVPANSPTLFNFPPVYTPIVFATTDVENPNHRVKITAQVVVDQSGHLVTDVPYYPVRLDTLGSDSNLRSAIGAAGITAVPR
jgi:hypothetical protein